MTTLNLHMLKPDVQAYLRDNEETDPAAIALRKSPFENVPSALLAQQIDGRRRCKRKLPLWYETPNIYYSDKLALEQASSQATAVYKAGLLPPNAKLADLTGGFGVDTFFFAKNAVQVVYCEQNDGLAEIVRHNVSILGAENIRIESGDGITFLQNQPDDQFNCLYIDPSRRIASRRVFRLEDCEPNVVYHVPLLLQKAGRVLIKSAPVLDITAAINVLQATSQVHIVSVDNECKELLFVLDRGYSGTPRLIAAMLQDGTVRTFPFTVTEERIAEARYTQPKTYLYEPDAALLKAGAFKLIAQRYGLEKLHVNTHLYTSENLYSDFMGRRFLVDKTMSYSDFKKLHTKISGNVTVRNFPLDAQTLRQRHRIAEHPSHFLFFCTGSDDSLLVIFASKC